MNSAVCCNSLLKRVSVSRQPLVGGESQKWADEMYAKSHDRQKTSNPKQDLCSLFGAIELSWYSKVCSLVTSPGLQINGNNEDGMTPLDVALLLGDTPIARVLQHHGARESPRYKKEPGVRYQHVMSLLQDAEIRNTNVLSNPLTAPLTSHRDNNDSKGADSDQKLWHYSRMLTTLKNTGLPGPPQRVTVAVLSSTCVKLECYEPADSKHALITQYRVERSSCPNFKSDLTTEIISAGHFLSHRITGLKKGVCYYFTVQAGNIKGFGAPSPQLRCTPSHWSDTAPPTDTLTHLASSANLLLQLRTQFSYLFPTLLTNTPSKPKPRNKSLSRIFTTPKFVKNLNRSLYLSVLHCTPSGKVLVSDFDKLPAIEVEDLVTAPSAEAELLWLYKHALAGWPGTRDLRDELAPFAGVGGIGLRYKILSAAIYLQDCLSCPDLGVPYYRLVRRNGQLLILLIKRVDPATPPFGGVHLKPLAALAAGIAQPRDAFDIAHLNAAELETLYARYAARPTPGLFVGLLLFRMKGEELEVVVDKAAPLLPPLEYVREVGHVTRDEWDSLTGARDTRAASVLCKQVSAAACALLSRVHDTESDLDSYGIYTGSIIELGDTSVILIVPPQVVAPLGSHDTDIEGTISVPLQHHEVLFNRMCNSELTTSLLHLTTHTNTCHAILTQLIRQTLSSGEAEKLRTSQEELKGIHEGVCEIWAHYSPFSAVLGRCMKETESWLRGISDLLRYTPTSPATSISETLTSGEASNHGNPHRQSGVVRIYSSRDVPVLSPCIKLHITSTTTSRDVISSVIRKLRRQNTEVALLECNVSDLGLVASVSNVIHHIPDDVQILQLGQPWVNAKFHIRYVD